MAAPAFALALVAALSGLVQGDDGAPADLARALRRRLEEIHDARARRRAEDAAHAARIAAADRQAARVAADVERIEGEVAAERARLAALEEERGRLAAACGALEGALSRAAAGAATVTARVAGRIRAGIPAGREARAAALEEAAARLAAGLPLAAGPALRAACTAAGQELRRARTIETWSEPVESGDRRLHAYRLRLGLAAEAFVAEDGSEAALHDPAAGGWRPADAQGRAALEAAIEAAAGRRAPALTALPFAGAGGGK